MKNVLLYTVAGLLVLSSCGNQTGQTGVTKDQLTFPFGNQLPSPPFTGEAYIQPMIQQDDVFNFPATNNITFAPGAHSTWHSHAGGQVLICTDGVGYHQIEGQPVEILHPGDVAKCPPGVKHWHGATPGCRFAHLAASTNPDRPGVEWFDLLPEEEYQKLPKE